MSVFSSYSTSSHPKLCVVMASNCVQYPGMVLTTATRTGKNHILTVYTSLHASTHYTPVSLAKNLIKKAATVKIQVNGWFLKRHLKAPY